MMMKQTDNYSQIVSWAKLWFNGPEKKACQENQIREMNIRSRRYFQETLQPKQEEQLVLQLTFQKFKFFNMPTLRHLIQIQHVWKKLNQTTTKMDQLLQIQHKKFSKRKGYQRKRKSFASSTIVYTHINQNQNHVLIQILPIEHQLLLKKEQTLDEDDDDDIPLGSLIKS